MQHNQGGACTPARDMSFLFLFWLQGNQEKQLARPAGHGIWILCTQIFSSALFLAVASSPVKLIKLLQVCLVFWDVTSHSFPSAPFLLLLPLGVSDVRANPR